METNDNIGRMPNLGFMEHLAALRKHIIRSVVAILLCGSLAFLNYSFIFDGILFAPKKPDFITNRLLDQLGKKIGTTDLSINQKTFQIISLNMSGQFTMHFMMAIIAGFILAFPFIFYQLWLFIKPALYENEIRNARGAVFYVSFLFMMGILFGYFVILPLTIHFLGSYSISEAVVNQIDIESYVTTSASTVLASGVVWELPVLIYFFSTIGLVTPKFLRKYRRHAIVLILFVAAVITPPDVFSQTLVAIPLFILYELGIFVSARVEKRRLKEQPLI